MSSVAWEHRMRRRRCLFTAALLLPAVAPLAVGWPSFRGNTAPRSFGRSWSVRARRAALNMCGVIGVVLSDKDDAAAQDLYDGLTLLQHRGQDAAGIATCDGAKICLRKDRGLVREVFDDKAMASQRGAYGIGHVRYRTAGSDTAEEAQPFFGTAPLGFCLAHNGHLTNAADLRDQLRATCHLNTGSDSEVLTQLFGQLLAACRGRGAESAVAADGASVPGSVTDALVGSGNAAAAAAVAPVGSGAPRMASSSSSVAGISLFGGGNDIDADVIFDTVAALMARCRGGYAVTIALIGIGVMAFRDPHGIRPLALGSRTGAGASGKLDWAVASESAGFVPLGFALRRSIAAGEAVIIDTFGAVRARICSPAAGRTHFRPCIFEYVYMARPDSVLDGVSVYDARAQMGLSLADRVVAALTPGGGSLADGCGRGDSQGGAGGNLAVGGSDEGGGAGIAGGTAGFGGLGGIASVVDVVVPVPDTSRIAALYCAKRLGVPYEEGLTKTNFAGRSFLLSGDERRRREVRLKLSPVVSVLRGRNVLLVDDSIVRGTTSKHIIRMVRAAGATRVFFASAAPPVRHCNLYGVDLPSQPELVAFGLSEAEVADAIGADAVVYQSVDALRNAVRWLNPAAIEAFEDSIFSGDYVTRDVGGRGAGDVAASSRAASSEAVAVAAVVTAPPATLSDSQRL